MNPRIRTAAGNIINKMRATYGKPLTRVPAAEADFRNLDLAMYRRTAREMEAAGFAWLCVYAIREVSESPTTLLAPTFIRAWIMGAEGIVGSYYQKRARWGRLATKLRVGLANGRLFDTPAFVFKAAMPRHCIEFSSEFADGSFVTTSNAEAAESIGMPPQLERKFHRYGTSAGTLLQDHHARIAAASQARGGARPLAMAAAEDLHAMLDREGAVKRDHRAAIGWITHAELLKMSKGKPELADAIYAEIRTLLREGY